MNVKFVKVIEIEGIGLFKCVSQWEQFSKWEAFENSAETFVSVEENDIMAKLFSIESNDREINIIYATQRIAAALEEINTAPEEAPTDEVLV